ncbi:MAG: T9SS type A sorting domain-containing protein [Bacteroidota bacterium]|nr:T9SS type A sorting domain-containing protein [Bacteroidota bacterium]MDP4230541.1 T9SS type A sorting domain-containing protein [Bacteroidota bacterium]MDP4236132.1 T9SS type A sorting domain-containing protein [Bacteroidota bacterium]
MKTSVLLFASILLSLTGAASNAWSQTDWVPTNGPYGGTIYCYAVSGEHIFAGTPSGGVFLSTNDGATWSAVNTGLTNSTIHDLAVVGTNVFAATEDGVFISHDNGAHWASASNGLTNTRVFSLTVSGTKLYASTNLPGSYVTTDNGSNWSIANADFTDISVRIFAGSGPNLYGIAWNDTTGLSAISYSSDFGNNWQRIETHGTINIQNLLVRDSVLTAMAYGIGIMQSTDQGAHWTYMGRPPMSDHVYALLSLDTNLIMGSDEGVYSSSDGGTTWKKYDVGISENIPVFALAKKGSTLLAGTEQHGTLRSIDTGLTWSSSNAGLSTTSINALATSGASLFAGAGKVGGVISDDNGTTWKAWNKDLPDILVRGYFVRKNDILASTDSGLFRSLDNGTNWTKFSSFNQISTFAESGSNLFGGGYGMVFRSSDDGVTWKNVFTDEVYIMFAIAAIGNNLCAATSSGVYVSDDDGTTWKNNFDFPEFTSCSAAIVNGSNFFVGTTHGVFLSTNGGTNWTARNSGLTDTSIAALVASGSNIFAGTANGEVFLSTDNGSNWRSVGSGLPTARIFLLATNGVYLFAGTGGASLWRHALADFGISSVSAGPQSRLGISISPNPSNGIMTVHDAPANLVRVAVSTILGETVLELLHPNASEFTLDVSKLPAGTYFAQFAMPGTIVTRKIVKE